MALVGSQNLPAGTFWQHLEHGINLEEGGTSRILLRQVLGGSNISLFDGGGEADSVALKLG